MENEKIPNNLTRYTLLKHNYLKVYHISSNYFNYLVKTLSIVEWEVPTYNYYFKHREGYIYVKRRESGGYTLVLDTREELGENLHNEILCHSEHPEGLVSILEPKLGGEHSRTNTDFISEIIFG